MECGSSYSDRRTDNYGIPMMETGVNTISLILKLNHVIVAQSGLGKSYYENLEKSI